MIRETSRIAMPCFEDCETMRALVLKAVVEHPFSTDRELAELLGFKDPNLVRPRRFELAEKGFVVEGSARKCRVSGRTAITWAAVKLKI